MLVLRGFGNARDGKWFDRVVLVEDTAEKDERRAAHGVSSDPTRLGTTACEADCTCQCQNLAVLLCGASLPDALDLWLTETDIPVNTNNSNGT